MDAFLTSAREAESLYLVNFSPLHDVIAAAHTVEEGREVLTALVDAYSTVGCSHAVYQYALIKAVGYFLRHVGGSSFKEGDDAAQECHWKLALDDYILLALFLNELSTVDDTQLFSLFTETVMLFFGQTVPLVYGDPAAAAGGVGDSSWDSSTVESLCSELQMLRVMMTKRLTTYHTDASTSQGGTTAMQLGIIDCLRALLMSLLQTETMRVNSSDTAMQMPWKQRDDVSLVVSHVVEGIVSPLAAAVEGLRPLVASGSHVDKAPALSMRLYTREGGGSVSPVVLMSALRVLEEIFWLCAGHVTSHDDGVGETSADSTLLTAGRLAVKHVFGALQQYLVLRQQQFMNSAVDSIEKGSSVSDVLRTTGVQWAVRRLLSVVRMHPVLFPSMETAVMAALNAFGGVMEVEDPFQLMRLRSECSEALKSNDSEKDAVLRKEWESPPPLLLESSPGSSASAHVVYRLRECEQILDAPRKETGTHDNGTAGEFGEMNSDDDASLLHGTGTSGRKETLLQSSVGPVPVSTLVDMVFLSVRHMDIMTEQAIQALHMQGLERMQNDAARRAQREEMLRLRRIEQQGVEGIPVGRLLENLKESTALYARGMHLLESESALAMMLRSAFFSLLDDYDVFAGETENRVLEAQALIARALAQLPSSTIDASLDAVCIQLRKDFLRCAHDKTTSLPPTSAYQLALQILFTLFSAQAPVRERGTDVFSFLAATNSISDVDLQLYGASMELNSCAAFTIDTDNPVEWLQSLSHDTVGGTLSGGKRLRDEENNVRGMNDNNENGKGDTENGGMSKFFREDTTQTPCLYSHFLCRVLELITEAQLPAFLLDVLLQCPCITRYVWNYIHKQYCLSTEKARCLLGMWLMKSLALRRTVYRRYAVNSLLHLASVRHEYPRRLAVTKLGELLSATGANGRRIIDANAEALLVQYAKRQMTAIPVTKLPPLTTSTISMANQIAKVEDNGSSTSKTNDEHDLVALREKEMRKLSDALDRHLGLFLMLCARQPKELFPTLLTVFREGVERQNDAMVHLLTEHVDVHRMCQRLFRTDAMSFMSNVMPYLRKHSRDATVLVQRILWAISSELQTMGQAAESSAVNVADVAQALLGHARAMYDNSEIPYVSHRNLSSSAAGGSSGGTENVTEHFHDVRFIAPFFSLIGTEELRQIYLRSFLHFVQLQLQHHQQQQQQQQQLLGSAVGVNADIGVAWMNIDQLHEFIRDAVREVLVRSSVPFSDGIPRGISRTELLVYLHRVPHEANASADPHSTTPDVHPMLPSGAERTESRGILGAAVSSEANAEGDAEAQQGVGKLPIGLLTTKEVILVLLKLTRTFDDTTTEFLYGPEEIKKAVRQLMGTQQIGSSSSSTLSSVPSQLMMTLILACKIHAQRPHANLVHFVHQIVLVPLARDAVWDKDPNIWRGVLIFAEEHYSECSTFLVNLPDKVLTQALRNQPKLRELFTEDHGSNGSFGHILESL